MKRPGRKSACLKHKEIYFQQLQSVGNSYKTQRLDLYEPKSRRSNPFPPNNESAKTFF
jgi:hypothetical protein